MARADRMDDADLLAEAKLRVSGAVGGRDSTLKDQRNQALKYYRGDPFGNEVEGRSKVVTRDVAQAIDAQLPQLMRIFSAGDEVVRFEPTGEEDVEAADQATDYCNLIWNENEGFLVSHTWFKDALLNKLGVIKLWWDDTPEVTRERYSGLDDAQLAALRDDPDIDVGEVETTMVPGPPVLALPGPPIAGPAPSPPPMGGPPPGMMPPGPPGMPPQGMGPPPGMMGPPPGMAPPGPPPGPPLMPMPSAPPPGGVFNSGPPPMVAVHDVAVIKRHKRGRVRIEPVPPDEFLFGRGAKSDRDADILAHRRTMTVSDLVAMGYDRDDIDRASGDDNGGDNEYLTRFRDVDEDPIRGETTGAMREVEVTEAYFRADRDGDGIAEYLKVTYLDNLLLDAEEIDDHAFACISPILMPHRLVGMSTADQTMDLQLVASTIQRQMLDNMYLQNAPMLGVVNGQVNLDDLLAPRRPGHVVRMSAPNTIMPIATTPLGEEPFKMLEYLSGQAEMRTGATRLNQGLDADTLNKTATGVDLIQKAGSLRVELIARVFAETGVKRAFKRILALVCMHQDKPRMVRLRGKWEPMDPRTWKSGMDLTVQVGLGTGNRGEIAQQMMQMLMLDEKIMAWQGGPNGPLLTMSNVHAKLKELIKAAGLKGVEKYYTDPATAGPPPPPPPDPKMIEVEGKLQLAQQEQQADAAAQQAQMQADEAKDIRQTQMAQAKAQTDAQLARWVAEQKIAVEEMQARADMAVERQKMQMQAELKMLEMRLDHKAELQAQRMKLTGDMAAASAAIESEPEPAEEAPSDAVTLADIADLVDAIGALREQMRTMHDDMTAPAEIVRGPDGRAAGVKRGGKVRMIKRGADGRAEGMH